MGQGYMLRHDSESVIISHHHTEDPGLGGAERRRDTRLFET